MRTLIHASSIATGSAVLIAASAFAQQPTAAQPDLNAAQIIQKLQALGYTAIEDIEKDDGVWEVEATSPSGARVDLTLDLKDGRILREERDYD